MIRLGSKVKNKILNYFFINEKRKVYVNELARLLEADPKNVHRALTQLEGEGILRSEFQGNQRYFFCNKENSLYKDYRNLFLKTAGLEAILKNRVEKITRLSEAYIFGSYAQNALSLESDIDILLVGEHDPLEAEKVLYGIQKEIGREINAVHIKPKDFEKKKKTHDGFITGIFKKPTIRIL